MAVQDSDSSGVSSSAASETTSEATGINEIKTSEDTVLDDERKKCSVIFGYVVVRKEDKSKAICMTCN